MKSKHCFQRFAAALTCLMLCALCVPGNAHAAEGPAGYRYKQLTNEQMNAEYTLDLEFGTSAGGFAGVEFNVYKVADMDREASFTAVEGLEQVITSEVNEQGFDDWSRLAGTVDAYVTADKMEPVKTAATDEDGRAVIEDLPVGLYLVKGDRYTTGFTTYTPAAFLVTLPSWDSESESWSDRTVNVNTKSSEYTYVPPATVQRAVLKVWEDEGYEDERPDSIVVELLRNGEVYDTRTLSAANNWRSTWSNLDASAQWQLVERIDEEAYQISIELVGSMEGSTFVVTNTYMEDVEDDNPPLSGEPGDDPGQTGEPGEPDDPGVDIDDPDTPLGNLPQTGQLWWPVPVLAVAGVMMFLFGLKRRSGASYEE